MILEIGNIKVEHPVILAPMAGVTDLPFRLSVKHFGAGLVCSEMLASRATVEHNRRYHKESEDFASQFPLVVQIAGCEPEIIAEAAQILEEGGAAIIDLNFGCPAKKIVNHFGGSALMKDELLSAKIMEQTVKAVKIPVTVKMRLGWDEENLNAPSMAKIAEQSGVKMITVHGRTRSQMFSGNADWAAIRAVKESVKLPVIANGDIVSPKSAAEALRQSGADGVMVGRGIYGRPWLLKQIIDYIEKGTLTPEPKISEIYKVVMLHYEEMLKAYGEYHGVLIARKHLSWYLQYLPEAEEVRAAIRIMPNSSDVKLALQGYFETAIEEELKC